MVDGIRKAKEDGLIGHIGFTTHDKVDSLLEYLPEVDWCEILLTTYNMLNTEYAPVIEAAHSLGIGTVTMNPISGGKLAEDSSVLKKLADEVGAASPADMAVRYVLSNPNIDTMLCGMKKSEDINDSIASVERGPFTPEQLNTINNFVKEIKDQASSFCTR